jgi:malate/lactate dehydrogenase
MPTIINEKGAQLVLTPPLSEHEKAAFIESASKVKRLIKQLDI